MRNNRAVICDFGAAIIDTPPRNHIRQPDMWCAPEIFFDQEVSTKSDVYSFGLVVWFTIESRGAEPFPQSTSIPMIRAAFKQHERKTFSRKSGQYAPLATGVTQITKLCFDEDPTKRPDAVFGVAAH